MQTQSGPSSPRVETALKALREKESVFTNDLSRPSTAQPTSSFIFASSPAVSSPSVATSQLSSSRLSASEFHAFPPRNALLETQASAIAHWRGPQAAACPPPSFEALPPCRDASAETRLSGGNCNVDDESVDLEDDHLPSLDAFSPFTTHGASGCSATDTNYEKILMVHCTFGCAPDHYMLPDAHLKLSLFIKHALYELGHSTDADRVAISFWCPHAPSSAHLAVPNIPNFGRHTAVHSFLDDFFNCALEMHSLNQLHANDFAYHVFHSYNTVKASLGSVSKCSCSACSVQCWQINQDFGNVFFHRSFFDDMSAYADHYSATVMTTGDSHLQHALICMGGDLTTLFAIKAAIQQDIIVFVIAQTGKLADCIAEVRQMQNNSKLRSEILACLSTILKSCTGLDGVNGSPQGVWLHVSASQPHKLSSFGLILFLQLEGRQPELFFPSVSEAIMFVAQCPLVHVLNVNDASASSQFSSLLANHQAVERSVTAPFSLIKRYSTPFY
jgi:hypothetical protein